MPLYIIHGDHQVASREHLQLTVKQTKAGGVTDIIRLNGKKSSLTEVIQATQSQSLFGGDKLVVIENLQNRPRSKIKTQIVNTLKTVQANPQSCQIILWEEKALTSPQLKALGNPRQQLFKLPQSLFAFLDSFYPGNASSCHKYLTQTLSSQSAQLIFAMLIRQIRLLIQLKSPPPPKLAPWQLKKLQTQANHFSEQTLLKIHQHFLKLDIATKTSDNILPLDKQLELTIAKYLI